MNRAKVSMISDRYIFEAVNRAAFLDIGPRNDPYRMLAAAVLLQAVIDKLEKTTERSYWYHGKLLCLRNDMNEEDYQFYADIAGIRCSSFDELLRKAEGNMPKFCGHALKDAAVLFCE